MAGGRYPNPYPPLEIPSEPGPLYGEPIYPGRGYLPRPGEDRPALSAWGRLSRGQPMGKRTVLTFDADGAQKQRAPTQILQLEGDDADARNLVITLSSPAVVPQAFEQTLAEANAQNLRGEQDNIQIQSRPNFPGEIVPISWPPFEAIIEWGVGGSASKASVDFINGSAVNVVASFVRVYAAVVSGVLADVSGTSAAYVLYANVGPGFARPGTAQKTVYVGEVGSLAESSVFAVPRFARSAYVVGCDPQAGPAVSITVATLRFWQSPNGVAGGNNVGNFVCSGNQPLPFMIPAGAAYASVINGMGVASRMSIVYNLAI